LCAPHNVTRLPSPNEWQVTYQHSKTAWDEECTLLFLGESAFYLLGVVTTWAPTGETSVLHCKSTRDQLSVISASSPKGQPYLTMQKQGFDNRGCSIIELKKMFSK
jgi:hypothetical protein